MNVCLLLITDGRLDYFDRALESAAASLPKFAQRVIVDDSAHRLGFAGAIQRGWDQVKTDWVFHLEDDFTFNEPVPLGRMIAVLACRPYLAQLVLKRQPWNSDERAAGGIIEQHPDQYEQVTDAGDVWTEHRKFWSTNPSVYSTGFCHQGWPQVDHSEGIFTHRLIEDPDLRFAFWGGKFDPPRVTHIGGERKGTGY